MRDPVIDAYRCAFDFALDALITTLKEAQEYLGKGEDFAAIGTLVIFDERVEDLKAARRLFIRALRVERTHKSGGHQ